MKRKKITPKQIAAVRDRLGLTNAELAEAIGVSERTIYNYLGGKRVPGPTVLVLRAMLERRI